MNRSFLLYPAVRNLFLSLLACFYCCSATVAQTTLTNPILAGFYPDPSIVRVGSDYYLVNSTFAYFPGLPIFKSNDLKNWKQIGNVISRPGQMNFLGARMTRGLFAPAISFNKGTFYVTCTHIDRKGNFVVTAKNPAGPWSDPVYLPEVQGIDPSLFFDDDKAYIIYNSDAPDRKPLYPGHRTIRMFELDPINLKVTGTERQLVNGGVDISKKPVWIEGPHIIKKNDWYYLYAAEGGTAVNHSEVVFRSRSVTGPFIPYKNNPILTQRNLPADRANPITSAGHAQFVEGPDGKTYAVFLAVRPYADDFYNTGRETFIAPVKWIDEWPVIDAGSNGVQYFYKAPFAQVKLKNILPQSGNFKYTLNFKNGLDPALLFMRTLDTSWFHTSAGSGLTLKLKPQMVSGLGDPAFIGKRQQHLFCTLSTMLNFNTNAANEKAGLVVFQSEQHFYYLCRSVAAGKPVIQLFKSTADSTAMELLTQNELPDGAANHVYLQIKAAGADYSFYFAQKPGRWQLLKDKVDGKFLSTAAANTFTGCIFGMYATSSGKPTSNTAAFKWLAYSGDDPVYR